MASSPSGSSCRRSSSSSNRGPPRRSSRIDLWRDRTYAASILSTFFVSFGFFGAIIFLPRFFQVVRGDSATASGYELFPLLIGLIGSSIISGFIVSRTGRYKVLVITGLVIMGVGVTLMTQITATMNDQLLWLYMFITGVGIGPTLSVFTIIIQNAVPFQRLGVATSNLTFFRQIGGSVGLAVAGTAFSQALTNTIPSQVGPVFAEIKAAAPPQFQGQFDQLQSGGLPNLDVNNLTGVGQSFGKAIVDAIVAAVPPQAQAAVQSLFAPYIGQLDAAFHNAFALAIGQTFEIGVVTTVIAVVIALFMKDIPLRRTVGAEAPAPAAGPAAEPVGKAAEPVLAPAVESRAD